MFLKIFGFAKNLSLKGKSVEFWESFLEESGVFFGLDHLSFLGAKLPKVTLDVVNTSLSKNVLVFPVAFTVSSYTGDIPKRCLYSLRDDYLQLLL